MQKFSVYSCRLYNQVIQPQGGIRYACVCIPLFLIKDLLKLNFCISSSSMKVDSLSINPFLPIPIEWPSVFLPLISNFPCTHARSILQQLIVKFSSCFEFSLHPRSINLSTFDCQIFLSFRIFLAPTLDQSFDSLLSNLPLIYNFPCTHAQSILRQLIVKSSSVKFSSGL